ncbi:MAG: J domain-containing protein [Planctomycetes bacterium]|nr:J domain-containing protein [Planctomycetota bacterium]
MSSTDPYTVLGVSPGADEATVRAAYLAAVKAHPPDRDPAAFERVRDAYEALGDGRRRARHALFDVDPFAPLAELARGRPAPRPYVGPGPWRALLAPGRAT